MEQPLLARKSEHLFTSLNTCPTRTCMNQTINFFCKNIIIGVGTLDILFGIWPYATFLLPSKREPKGGGTILRCRTKESCKKPKARKYVQSTHNWPKKANEILKSLYIFYFLQCSHIYHPKLAAFIYLLYLLQVFWFFFPLFFLS